MRSVTSQAMTTKIHIFTKETSLTDIVRLIAICVKQRSAD